MAYIVNRSINHSDLNLIYKYNTEHWGGLYNLFVPTDGDSIRNDWLHLLTLHDPDVLFLVGEIDSDLVDSLYLLLQPLGIFNWDAVLSNVIAGKPTTVDGLQVNAILESILAENGRQKFEQSNMRYPESSGDFSKYLEIICGSWHSNSNYLKFSEEYLGAIKTPLHPRTLSDYLSNLDMIHDHVFPLDISAHQLKPSFGLPFALSNHSVVVSNGLIDDLFLYHAMRWSGRSRNLKWSKIIVPIQSLASDNDYDVLAKWLGSSIRGNTFDLVSHSMEMDVLQDIREKLRVYLTERSSLSARSHWHIHIRRCNVHIAVPTVSHLKRTQLVEKREQVYSFAIPKLKFGGDGGDQRFQNKQMICEVNLSPKFGDKRAYTPSMFSRLNFLLSGYPSLEWFQHTFAHIRIARGQLALLIDKNIDMNSIRIPNDKVTIETACEDAGFEVKADQRNYYKGIMSLLGSIEKANFLHNANIRQMFLERKFIKGEAITHSEIITPLKRKQADSADFVQLVQGLAGNKILLRGYQLKCPTCGLESWYNLGHMREHMLCEGCQTRYQLPLQVDFVYKLNRLFTDKYNQGVVTVLLSLLLLKQTSRDGLIWQADVNLKKNDQEVEIDVIAMCDGALILIECKNSFLPFNDGKNKANYDIKRDKAVKDLVNQLDRQIAIAHKLEAHLFLFATLEDDVPDEVKDFLHEQDSKHNKMRIRLVAKSELIEGKFKIDGGENNFISIYEIIGKDVFVEAHIADDCTDIEFPKDGIIFF
ncbi:MAG: NERD domain-containing protein [Anaerolineae bacterium]|nr:NERD domain-containing protein [Anaerolineae bacterium]